ncbi:hypothetical protein BDV98DRAFT_601636 [Pterulicium gracile]|uniref:Uncharacterized protein n=1 Tax=Pterulicium gracile TaxID=1884261 RepID=A0A5C3QV30_9AGAR|nr:hypothetical protein BDV98DRAFT_601636 [Pterula gracilis]
MISTVQSHSASIDATLRNKLDTNVQAREIIDKQMKDLETQLISLKARRNQHTSISVLPPEVLSLILTLSVQALDTYKSISWRRCNELTTVCKFWRTVALETPALWSDIMLRECRKLPQMLARSKHSPLSLRVDQYIHARHSRTLTAGTLQAILIPTRLQRLHVRCDLGMMREYVEHFPQEAPLLESLHLRCTDDYMSMSYPLPPQVLLSPKPALRHITLTSCVIPWSSIPEEDDLLSNLYTLAMHRTSPPIPSALLWKILSSSPNLEQLELSHALSPTLGSDAAGSRTVELRHLERMTLADHPDAMSQLLRCLKLPPVSQVEIRVEMPLDSEEDQSPFFSAIIESCGVSVNNGSSTQWNSLQAIIEDGSVDLIFRSLSGDEAETSSLWNDIYRLRVPRPQATGPRLKLLFEDVRADDVLRNLHIQGLQNMSLTCLDSDHPCTSRWADFFERHSAICGLHLAGGGIYVALEALGSPQDVLPPPAKGKRGGKSTRGKREEAPVRKQTQEQSAAADVPSKQLLLPTLRSIDLEEQNFLQTTCRRHCPAFRTVEDMLIDRCNYHVPIDMLKITESRGFNETTLASLEHVAGAERVSWDGHYGAPAESMDDSDEDYDDYGYDYPYYDDGGADDDDIYSTGPFSYPPVGFGAMLGFY